MHQSALIHYFLARTFLSDFLRIIVSKQVFMFAYLAQLTHGVAHSLMAESCIKFEPHFPLVLALQVQQVKLLLLDYELVLRYIAYGHRVEIGYFTLQWAHNWGIWLFRISVFSFHEEDLKVTYWGGKKEKKGIIFDVFWRKFDLRYELTR